MQILIAYAVTAALFFGMDFAWLSLSFKPVYHRHLGGLLLDKPNLPVAGLFYLMYVVGILVFAVLPARDGEDWFRALWAGALLGAVAYGTYDMTNLSTLAGWSPLVSVVDMLWGTVATATAATGAYFILRAL
jgi:uncharacterized membrane protein